MATSAFHELGDVSRKVPSLCCVYGEDEENYVGRWTYGYGFMGVKFPKKSTRPLTQAEKREFGLEDLEAIILPKDKALQEKLKIKMKEYETRISSCEDSFMRVDATCKTTILKILFERGKATEADLSNLNLDYIMRNAWWVIWDYCKTGGKSVSGGTGLPSL